MLSGRCQVMFKRFNMVSRRCQVQDGFQNVSDGVRKVSDGVMKVSHHCSFKGCWL